MAKKKSKSQTLYKRLRARMSEKGVTGADLAQSLCICPMTFSRKLTGKCPWQDIEMYRILDRLDVDIGELPAYFPPNGVEIEDKREIDVADWLRERDLVTMPRATAEALKALVGGIG